MSPVSEIIARQLLSIDKPHPKPLTQRQWEVAMLVILGHSDKEIVAQLGIQLKTMQDHLRACYIKMGLVRGDGKRQRASGNNYWGNPRVRLTLALQAR